MTDPQMTHSTDKIELTKLSRFIFQFQPSQAIQCLDVILRAAFKSLTAANRAVNVGRALYMPTEGHKMDLGEGMEVI